MNLRIALPLVLAALFAAPLAHGDAACISAYEQTQTLRKDGKPLAARAQAATCARDTCPALLAKDCTRWLSELDALIPSVVLDPRSPSGAPRPDVHVKMDGVVVKEKIDGKPLPVEPGSHRFVFDGVESTVFVREGEKLRKVTVTVTSPALPEREAARPIPTGVWIFGGVSVVAFATSAFFAIDALGKKSDLEECKPRCAAADVDAMSSRFTFADVALGAGAMAGAAALYLYFTRPTLAEREARSEPRTAGVSGAKPLTLAVEPYAVPLPGGAAAGVVSRF